MDEQGGGVDELPRGIYIRLLQALHVAEELRRDARDGDVVNIDVLLADQVEQQVERSFVDPSYRNGEGRRVVGLGALVCLRGGILRGLARPYAGASISAEDSFVARGRLARLLRRSLRSLL